MPKKNKADTARIDNLKKAMKRESHYITNILQFAFSVLINGGTYTQVSLIFLSINIVPPCSPGFHRASKKVFDVISAMAIDSMREYRHLIQTNEEISIDGSYSHRRNPAKCVVSVMSSRMNKVIDCEIVEKGAAGNHDGSSNTMEAVGVRRILQRWIEEGFHFETYCHDNDGPTRAVFRELYPGATEKLDRNHLIKQFGRIFQKFNRKNCLRGLKSRLEKWLVTLLYSDFTCLEKEQKWLGAFEHYTTIASPFGKAKWNLANNIDSIRALKELLNATVFIVRKCSYVASTQNNECLHSLKVHFANKLFTFDRSFRCRIFASILQMNKPHYWIFEARRRLGLPILSLDTITRLLSTFAQNMKRKITKSRK